MNSFRIRPNRNAFTLVELLVVISIIAILAGVIVASVGTALRFAKRTKANVTASQIQNAIQSYYTEYGLYPTESGAGAGTDTYYDGKSDGPRWQNLMYALCGNINPLTGQTITGTVPNTRAIAYLTPSRSDLDTVYGTFKNPFGTSQPGPYFFLAMDTDYNGVLGDAGPPAGKLLDFSGKTVQALSSSKALPTGVAVWCSCDQALTGSTSSAWAHTY